MLLNKPFYLNDIGKKKNLSLEGMEE